MQGEVEKDSGAIVTVTAIWRERERCEVGRRMHRMEDLVW